MNNLLMNLPRIIPVIHLKASNGACMFVPEYLEAPAADSTSEGQGRNSTSVCLSGLGFLGFFFFWLLFYLFLAAAGIMWDLSSPHQGSNLCPPTLAA